MARPDDGEAINPPGPIRSGKTRPRAGVLALGIPVLFVVLAGAGVWFLSPFTAPPAATRQFVVQPGVAPTPPREPLPAARTSGWTPDAVSPTLPIPNGVAALSTTGPPPAEPSPRLHDFKIETATEQTILKHVPVEAADDPAVFRFSANPRILVLDFSSLRAQGRMLNRTAALVEKTGLPRDRLLNDVELDAAIRASGDTVETFYYGHDYGAASLVRFFALADRDNVRLSDEEETLRGLVRQEGWFKPDVRAALISIPRAGADDHVTPPARATILHHELSHGEYFTNPAYTAFVHGFWARTLTAGERDRIRGHLHTLGYDSSLDDVMENEAQAYLMFTESAEFFTPDMFGMSRGRVTELRAGFFRSMPAGWLRDSLGRYLTRIKTPAVPQPSPGGP